MIEALDPTADREQWRLFCDAWWEIGVRESDCDYTGSDFTVLRIPLTLP